MYLYCTIRGLDFYFFANFNISIASLTTLLSKKTILIYKRSPKVSARVAFKVPLFKKFTQMHNSIIKTKKIKPPTPLKKIFFLYLFVGEIIFFLPSFYLIYNYFSVYRKEYKNRKKWMVLKYLVSLVPKFWQKILPKTLFSYSLCTVTWLSTEQ